MAILLTKTQKVQMLGSKGAQIQNGNESQQNNLGRDKLITNSHSMFIKPTVLLVRSVVEDGISITVYWYKASTEWSSERKFG